VPVIAVPKPRTSLSGAASFKHAVSEPLPRPKVHTDSASSDTVDANQLAYVASLYAGVAEAKRVVREVEKIRAGGSSPPPCEAEANTKPVVSNPISPSEVHFNIASARAAADRNHLPSDPATTSQAVPRTDAAMGSTASAATSRRPGETLARTKPTSAAESRPAHVAQTGLDRVAPVMAVTVEASTPTVSPASAKPDGQKPALPIKEGPIIPIGGRPYRLLQRNPSGRVR